jgi:hypothetical protein
VVRDVLRGTPVAQLGSQHAGLSCAIGAWNPGRSQPDHSGPSSSAYIAASCSINDRANEVQHRHLLPTELNVWQGVRNESVPPSQHVRSSVPNGVLGQFEHLAEGSAQIRLESGSGSASMERTGTSRSFPLDARTPGHPATCPVSRTVSDACGAHPTESWNVVARGSACGDDLARHSQGRMCTRGRW